MRNLLAALLTLTLFGCATSKKTVVSDDDMLLSDNALLSAPPSLTKQEADQDFAVLVYAFKNGYGGRNYIPKADFDRALSDFNYFQRDVGPKNWST